MNIKWTVLNASYQSFLLNIDWALAKYYCIDCLNYDEEYKFCRDLGIRVTDDKFCCWGKPDMSKKHNVKDEK